MEDHLDRADDREPAEGDLVENGSSAVGSAEVLDAGDLSGGADDSSGHPPSGQDTSYAPQFADGSTGETHDRNDVVVPPQTWAGALANQAAAEKRATTVLDEGRLQAEAVRLRGRQEARHIIQRAEERVQQILELCASEAETTERRARTKAHAILIEAQLWLDVFTQDHGEMPADVEELLVGENATALPDDAEAANEPDDETTGQFARLELGEMAEQAGASATMAEQSVGDASDGPANRTGESRRNSASEGDSSQALVLTQMPNQGDAAIYRITGPLTFARIMAIEEALGGFEGVKAVSVTPESADVASIAFVSEDPPGAIDSLIELIPELFLDEEARD